MSANDAREAKEMDKLCNKIVGWCQLVSQDGCFFPTSNFEFGEGVFFFAKIVYNTIKCSP